MAVIFRCARYPFLRVRRFDGTYIEFHKNEFIAETVEDVKILRETDCVAESAATVHAPLTKELAAPLPVDDRIVNWYSPVLGTADGYGSSAEQMILALEKRGYSVRIPHGIPMSSQQTYIGPIMSRPYTRGSTRIVYSPPNAQQYGRQHPDQVVLGFSMWEDSSLPPAFDECIKRADAFAAPSQYSVDLFRARIAELGLETPVCYVPLGITSELYPFSRRTFHKGNETFVVYHACTIGVEKRKGALEAYQAFCKAFEGQTDVKLILRSKWGHINEVLGDKRVEVKTGVLDDKQKLDLLYGAHVLLYPSRGEGFGLIPLEAMASWLPAIVAANTSMLDYIDLAMPIECSPEPSEITPPWRETPDGEWMTPSVEDAAKRLRFAYDNYPKVAAQAARSSKTIAKRWTYELTADALVGAMETARAARIARLVSDAGPTQE